MWKQITSLIDVKSIVTLSLVFTMVFVILSNIKVESNMFQLFSSAVMLVLGFFFGKNTNKSDSTTATTTTTEKSDTNANN